ncbi:MAG: ComEC/Rec2 family competence protein [Candidatus Pacebacteria bacterium]|nr:ComEC/Rec2 family competence protein [Candidatus Paceibacterota bacterium]
MTQSQKLVSLCIAFAFGIIFPFNGSVFLILGLAILISFISTDKRFLGALLITIWFGSFWYASHLEYDYTLKDESFSGVIIANPKPGQFVLRVDHERVLLTTEPRAHYKCGDVVMVDDMPKRPEPFDGFDYPNYLAKDGIRYTVFSNNVSVIDREKLLRCYLYSFKDKAQNYIFRALPEPNSSIVSAMLLGEKRGISDYWRDVLAIAGVSHIVAVSGLHVTVISVIFFIIANNIGISRRRALLFVILAVLFFVLMTGLQSSAIRAGIMGTVASLAIFFGRMNNSLRIIFITAAIMLFFNPLLLAHDIGFQLSFLAVLGIILYSYFFEKIFWFAPAVLKEILAMSFASYVFTFPVLMYHFGSVSLVFPITNILIIPLLYPIMITGIAFVFTSFVSEILAFFLLIPLWLMTQYLVLVVSYFSSFDWSSISFNIFWTFVIVGFFLFWDFKPKEVGFK